MLPRYVSPASAARTRDQLRRRARRTVTDYWESHGTDAKLPRVLEEAYDELHAEARRVEEVRRWQLEHSPYQPDGEYSWVWDNAMFAVDRGASQPLSRERLAHHREAADKGPTVERFSIASSLFPWAAAAVPPYVEEALALGVRSGAPLAAALERLDLPPKGTKVSWATVTTPVTVGVQTAENTAGSESDDAVSSRQDALATIMGYIDFSAQVQELSGGWWDRVAAFELGRAFGAQLEAQIWAGTGASGQMTGFTVMAGASSSTVAGQTLANITAKILDQYQQISANLGAEPDLVALAPRRYGQLQAATAALGLPVENVFPASLRERIVVSPAAPTNLGGGTEDWIVMLNRASTPLVRNLEPTLEFHREGPAAGTNLTFRWIIRAYATLGVHRRPEGVGIVKGATTPTF